MPSTNSAKLALLLALAAPFASAQTPSEQHPSAQFRTFLDDTFNKHLYVPKFPKSSQWLDGSQRYTALEPSATDPKQLDLVVYVTATGERSVLIPAARFTPAVQRLHSASTSTPGRATSSNCSCSPTAKRCGGETPGATSGS